MAPHDELPVGVTEELDDETVHWLREVIGKVTIAPPEISRCGNLYTVSFGLVYSEGPDSGGFSSVKRECMHRAEKFRKTMGSDKRVQLKVSDDGVDYVFFDITARAYGPKEIKDLVWKASAAASRDLMGWLASEPENFVGFCMWCLDYVGDYVERPLDALRICSKCIPRVNYSDLQMCFYSAVGKVLQPDSCHGLGIDMTQWNHRIQKDFWSQNPWAHKELYSLREGFDLEKWVDLWISLHKEELMWRQMLRSS